MSVKGWLQLKNSTDKDEVELVREINDIQKVEDERAKWTPDHLKLAQYSEQYLFVVDNMKKSQNQHWFIKDVAELKYTAYTSQLFQSWNNQLGSQSYNIPLEYDGGKLGDLDPPPSRIAGELFLISDSKVIEAIDKLRQNGVRFHRKRVETLVPFRRTKWIKDINKIPPELVPVSPSRATTGWITYRQKAWMYVGIKDYWEPLLDGGFQFKPTPLVHPNSGWTDHYYLFNNKITDD